jgi:hypothetical protein
LPNSQELKNHTSGIKSNLMHCVKTRSVDSRFSFTLTRGTKSLFFGAMIWSDRASILLLTNDQVVSSLARFHFGARRKQVVVFWTGVVTVGRAVQGAGPPWRYAKRFVRHLPILLRRRTAGVKKDDQCRSEFIIQDAALRVPPYFDGVRIGRSLGPRLTWRRHTISFMMPVDCRRCVHSRKCNAVPWLVHRMILA